MRQGCIWPGGDDRFERRPFEPGLADSPVDVERELAFALTCTHRAEDIAGHLGQQPPCPPQRHQLVGVFHDANALDDAFRLNELNAAPEMALEPAPTTDGQMGRLETHARHIVGRRPFPGRRNFAQQLREPGVVGPLDLHEIELRALERFPPRVGDRRHVPRVGQEQQALRRDHDDRGGARKIRQIQNVRKRGDDERLELELESGAGGPQAGAH